MNQMLTSQANFSRTFLRGKATDVFSSRVLIFRGYQAVPKYPAVERPGRSPEYRTKHRLSVLQDTATDQLAVMMQPTVANIEDDGQAKQRALAVLVAAFIEIVSLMPLDTGVHWLGTIDLIYSTVIADLNEKRQANTDVSFADITAANIGTFGADEPMAAFWTDFVDMANVIFAKIAMEYINHPGIADAMADEAKSATAMTALLSSDRLKALMSEHFQELVAETRDIAREKLGITEPPLNEDEALQARQDAAQRANEVAEELENDDGSLSDDAMAGTGNQQVRGLDEDDPDEPTAPKSKVELLLIAINHHAQANVAGDWTTQHVMAITAAITSAPPAATSPYCPKRLLQYIATHGEHGMDGASAAAHPMAGPQTRSVAGAAGGVHLLHSHAGGEPRKGQPAPEPQGAAPAQQGVRDQLDSHQVALPPQRRGHRNADPHHQSVPDAVGRRIRR